MGALKTSSNGMFSIQKKPSTKFGLLVVITGGITEHFLWKIRGYIDQFYGGTGLRRGRRSPTELLNGDALDFWRVIYADKEPTKIIALCRNEAAWRSVAGI